jgi:hypothetical protein
MSTWPVLLSFWGSSGVKTVRFPSKVKNQVVRRQYIYHAWVQAATVSLTKEQGAGSFE